MMDYFRRNYKAIAGALVGVLSVLLPAYVTTGTISPQTWGLAVIALIGGHQIVYATPANKVTVAAALGVVLPVLSQRSPYAAESLKAAIGAVPEYVPTVVHQPVSPPTSNTPAAALAPTDSPPTWQTVATPAATVTPTRPPSPVPVGSTAAPVAYAGPVPPVSEPVGATAAPAS